MNSGITVWNVDRKGRILVPKNVRRELVMGDQVLVEREKTWIILKPTKKIDDPIDFLSSLNVKTRKTPVEMKREAEQGF